jgi:hypothetical protein
MTEALPTDGDRCPTCGQRVERGWYGDDLTNGYFPVAERAARINLAMVERLRAREAALTAVANAARRLNDRIVEFWPRYPWDEYESEADWERLGDALAALAADPSAPATTEGRP